MVWSPHTYAKWERNTVFSSSSVPVYIRWLTDPSAGKNLVKLGQRVTHWCCYPQRSSLCLKTSATSWHAVCPWVGDTVWVPLGWNTKYIFSTSQMICRHLALSVVLRTTQAENRVTSRLSCGCGRWVITQLKSLSVPGSERCPSIPSRSLW